MISNILSLKNGHGCPCGIRGWESMSSQLGKGYLNLRGKGVYNLKDDPGSDKEDDT